MTREERLAALKAAGINTDNFVLELGNMAPGSELKIVIGDDGTPQLIGVNTDNTTTTPDPILQNIFANGYVKNTKLHRRFVTAQMWEALNYTYQPTMYNSLIKRYVPYGRGEKGFDAWLRHCHDYNYTFEMTLEEIKVLWKLQESDKDCFNERVHFFNTMVVDAICEDYVVKLKEYVKTLKIKHCKGIEYVTVGSENFFVSDLNKKLYVPCEASINEIVKYSGNYKQIYYRFRNFINNYVKRYKLPYSTRKNSYWIDAYKGNGAYYTMKNLLMFHDCFITNYETGEVLFGYKGVKYLESNLNSYEGWHYLAQLKKMISDNHFDLGKSIESHK